MHTCIPDGIQCSSEIQPHGKGDDGKDLAPPTLKTSHRFGVSVRVRADLGVFVCLCTLREARSLGLCRAEPGRAPAGVCTRRTEQRGPVHGAGMSTAPPQASAFGVKAGPLPLSFSTRSLTQRGTQGCLKALSWYGRTWVPGQLPRRVRVLGSGLALGARMAVGIGDEWGWQSQAGAPLPACTLPT